MPPTQILIFFQEYLVIFDTYQVLIDCDLSLALSAYFVRWGKFAKIVDI